MNQLQQFHFNREMYDAVKVFFFDHLKDITIKKAFAGESTEGISEAKNALQNAFKQLDDTYGVKVETKATNVSE